MKFLINFATVISDDALTPKAREERAESGASIFSVIESALSSTLLVLVIVCRSSFRIKKICIPSTTRSTVSTKITISKTSWTGSIIVMAYLKKFNSYRLFIDYLNCCLVSSKGLERNSADNCCLTARRIAITIYL